MDTVDFKASSENLVVSSKLSKLWPTKHTYKFECAEEDLQLFAFLDPSGQSEINYLDSITTFIDDQHVFRLKKKICHN